ncbi:phenylacetic acid degradation protein [Effusibacillus lacus]|uniref:Medium/long-chain acyl-CoA thioesterase YigI n=1 Tax=Effusibacillus lacus TaxID=1348429 RepID=A0A292YLM8_9BACL|nr:acyl-CoA thioesterase [Effusibacillus lacus]GAX89284.1 phenylacetic acid degradation protein [Effusibacillus lacus]
MKAAGGNAISTESKNRFNHYLGIEIQHLDDQGCKAALKIRPDFYNSIDGVVHGGVTSTLADVAMGYAAAPHVDGVQQCVTVESKISYLAPARGDLLLAESKVIKRGSKIIVMEARITTGDGELVAVALGTYARVKPK